MEVSHSNTVCLSYTYQTFMLYIVHVECVCVWGGGGVTTVALPPLLAVTHGSGGA